LLAVAVPDRADAFDGQRADGLTENRTGHAGGADEQRQHGQVADVVVH
jgi:hypothetical protein